MQIIPVNNDELIQVVEKLAFEIWNEYYPGLVPQAQIDYMLKNLQSFPAVKQQIEKENYKYYLIKDEQGYAGYFAVVEKTNELFLSKLYVRLESRKNGFAKKSIEFVKNTTKKPITLTVNKGNASSITAYEKMGFKNCGEQNAYIGGGFYMDDYLMELEVK